MIETMPTQRHREAIAAAHAERGAALRETIKWIGAQFHLPLHFGHADKTLTVASR